MKLLGKESKMSVSPEECAREILEVVPLIMRAIRAEMRSHRTPDLSVPQFRTLAYLSRHAGASLSDVAEHIGLTLPSMSKMMDGLVTRQLVTREICPSDRRRVTLALTTLGWATWQSSREATQAHLSQLLVALSATERATVVQAMQALRPIFMSGRETESK
jgi:DNA-binding MarR family transcriptional regulator